MSPTVHKESVLTVQKFVSIAIIYSVHIWIKKFKPILKKKKYVCAYLRKFYVRRKKLIHKAQIRKYKKEIDPQIINPQLATFVEGPLI
jgi:hypothetical protein